MKICALTLFLIVGTSSANKLTKSKPRIVGGHPVDILDFPYQISLEYAGSHACGGSIVSTKYVITASHCITPFPPFTIYQVRVNTSVVETGGSVYQIKNVYQHPDFDLGLNCDISILELEDEIELGSGVQAVKLPGDGDILKDGDLVTVSGWGDMHYGDGEPADQLQAVDLNIVSYEKCFAIYGGGIWGLTESMLCAAVEDFSKDACKGDSGGPLVKDNVLHGIVSWGRNCGSDHTPGVYTNVTAVRDFIREITNL